MFIPRVLKKINLRTSFGYIIFYNLAQKISLTLNQKSAILHLLSRAVCIKLLYTLVPKMNFYTLANEKRDFTRLLIVISGIFFARDYKNNY